MNLKEIFKDSKGLTIAACTISVLVIALIGTLVFASNENTGVITLNETEVSLIETETLELKLNNVSETSKIKWSSSDSKVVDVDAYGKITAKNKGDAIVVAEYSNKRYSCDVEVEALEFTISQYFNLTPKESKKIEVTKNLNMDVTFSSEDESIATVDKDGNVVGVKKGSTKIIVKLNGVSRNCNINVIDKEEDKQEVVNEDTTKNNNSQSSTTTQTSNKKPNNQSQSNTNTNTKPNSGSNNSNSSNNSNTSSGSNGSSSTPTQPETKPETKPEEKPQQPQVTYSYMGQQVYNWILNEGGKVLHNGKAYYGNPNTTGIGSPTTIEFLANIENVGKPDCDYVAVLSGTIVDKYPEVMYIVNHVFDGGEAIIDKVLDGNLQFKYNGRKYNVWSDKYGYHFEVSAKETIK